MTQLFSQTIAATSTPQTFPISGTQRFKANGVVRNLSSFDASVTYLPDAGVVACPANAVTLIPDVNITAFSLTGSGSVSVVFAWPEFPSQEQVTVQNQITASISSGTVTANIGTTGSLALDASVQTTNNLLGPSPVANGGSMPFHGSFIAFLEGSGAEPTLAIGAGSAQKINAGVSLASGSGLTYKGVAQSGQSVTFAACTVRSLLAFPSGG